MRRQLLAAMLAALVPALATRAAPHFLDGPGRPYRMTGADRDLDRWRLREVLAASGPESRSGDWASWQRLRYIVGFSSALVVETLLIGGLLVERRRRRSAERRAREDLAVIAHLNRVGSMGELVGSFAHELNTPLGAVLNNAQAARRLLAQGASRMPDVLACLEDIVSDSCRAGEVVRRMRGVMRREDPREVEVEVAAVIRDAVRLVEAEARDRDIELATSVDPGLPLLRGDDVQLVQVVLNLLMNALDALASAPLDRRKVVVLGTRQGDGVEIRVIDNGPGIPLAQQQRVFEPFFTTKSGGLGLGLAISRSIVEAHGGSIRVSPAPQGGTVFQVLLPGTSRPAAHAVAPEASA